MLDLLWRPISLPISLNGPCLCFCCVAWLASPLLHVLDENLCSSVWVCCSAERSCVIHSVSRSPPLELGYNDPFNIKYFVRTSQCVAPLWSTVGWERANYRSLKVFILIFWYKYWNQYFEKKTFWPGISSLPTTSQSDPTYWLGRTDWASNPM